MEIIIFAAILVVALGVCYAMWRDSKKQHEAVMKEVTTLKSQLEGLLADYDEMEKEVDEAEEAMRRIDEEIEFEQELNRVLLALNKKMITFDN